jgi:chromosome segregation ATPase
MNELQAAEMILPNSTRPLTNPNPQNPRHLQTWMTTNALESSLRAEQRQRQEMAQEVLAVEQRLRDAQEDANRGASALLNERARAEAADTRASTLAHEKKRLQREAARLKELLERTTAKQQARRSAECEECDKALASTVARFRQQQRAWVRERQRMAGAAQEMGTHMVDKEQQLERAAVRVDKMQREMETAVIAAQEELGERDASLAGLREQLEEAQAQCAKASALLARSERERLEVRSGAQQLTAELEAKTAQLGGVQQQLQQTEQRLRELLPIQQRAAVLEAEKAALGRELELARSHGEDLLKAAREETEKTARRESRVPARTYPLRSSCWPPHLL